MVASVGTLIGTIAGFLTAAGLVIGFIERRIRPLEKRMKEIEKILHSLDTLAEVLRDENVRQMRHLVHSLIDERDK